MATPLNRRTKTVPQAAARGSAMDLKSVFDWMEAHANARARDQMEPRFGITTDKAFGVSMADLKRLAKSLGKDHALAQSLWDSGWHEAKALAALIDDPDKVPATQMDAWCKTFRNWADCDTACFCLFDRTPHAFHKVRQWARRKPEFEKRAAFALLASLALHDKQAGDDAFLSCFPLITAAAADDRNFVKKGVSWALRAIGWRNAALHAQAIELATRLARSKTPAERWIGKDVLKDITRPLVRQRVARKRA